MYKSNYVQDVYVENYKTQMKEIKENLNKQRHIPCYCREELKIVKMSVFSSLIYRFSAIPTKVPKSFFWISTN